ncbi:MAG: GAF domain-containing protein [Elusimicrobia bacterium]|nr:GAF domain-containing protein [Elusimicrobiota bacterium]
MMWYFSLSGLLSAVASTVFGLLVFIKNPHDSKNRTYAFFCLAMAVWSYNYFLWQISGSERWALFFCRGLMMGAIVIPVAHFHHFLTLLGRRSPRLLTVGYLLCGVYLLSNFTPLFVAGVEPRHLFRYWPIPGLLFHPYLAGFIFYAGCSLWIILRARSETTSHRRNQLAYLLIATLLGYAGGATNFPLWYNIPLTPWGNMLSAAYVITFFYILVRYRLLDIELVARDSLIHGMVGLVWAIPFVLVVTLSRPSLPILIGLFLIAILGASFVFRVGTPWVEKIVDRVIFQGRYDYLKDLKALGGSLYHIYSLNQLLETLVQGLVQTMRTKSCCVLMWDAAGEEFRLEAQKGLALPANGSPGEPIRLTKQNPLIRAIEQHQGPLLKEELARQRTASQYYVIAREMELLQAELVLPLYSEGQMRGVLTLGPKRSGAMYNQKDFQLLEKLADDAERILSYMTVIYEQALTTAKIAHDARQPFQPIKSWLCRIRSGKMPPEEIPMTVRRVETYVEFVHEFFTDLMELNTLIVQRVRGEVKFAPVDLSAVLRQVTEGLRSRAVPGVELTLDLPKELPTVFGQERGIERVFNNLVVNALKFTKQGSVQVRVQAKRDWVEVRVQDTGPGISEAELPRLFEPFAQTREPERNVVEGMGLGLTIVKEVVALHEGQLRVESRLGEGTIFIVGLPTVDSGFAATHQRGQREGHLRPSPPPSP